MIVTDKEGDHTLFLWLSKRTHVQWSSDLRTIGLLDKDKNIAAVCGFNGHMGNCCQMHIAIEGKLTRPYIRACFGYPFKTLGYACVIGLVAEGNKDALRFDQHIGFKEVHRIRQGASGGEDLIILEMRREDCRWLGD